MIIITHVNTCKYFNRDVSNSKYLQTFIIMHTKNSLFAMIIISHVNTCKYFNLWKVGKISDFAYRIKNVMDIAAWY